MTCKAKQENNGVRPHLYVLRDQGLVVAEVTRWTPTKWRLK